MDHLTQSSAVKAQLAKDGLDAILAAAALVAECFRAGGKVLLCGNGGSAADCQHVSAEFVSRLTKDFTRPALPAIALTTDTSFITAFANDLAFEGIFARQVEALGKAGDVVWGISTSGESRNVALAFAQGRKQGLKCLALVGSGGSLAATADAAVRVPSTNTQFVQESHLAIEHIICDLVERMLFGAEKS
jgi:D-sedoheptulose 7-phosphate isomerase